MFHWHTREVHADRRHLFWDAFFAIYIPLRLCLIRGRPDICIRTEYDIRVWLLEFEDGTEVQYWSWPSRFEMREIP